MKEKLLSILPESRIRTRYIDLVSFAADAGFYYLLPKAVVQPVNESEIIALFRFSHENKVPLVFRTGGTSLSGQSITDGILVDLSQYWNKASAEANGSLVRVQPGITGAMVNAKLKRFGRKIGPDPSSISSAMMGGILSNNSSGMCCGVRLNSYHTTKFIRFILPDGKMFSTENPLDYGRFESECRQLFYSLAEIKQEIFADDNLLKKIRSKYLTKTTIGYSLNAFVDFAHPLDILAHLLIGAEGTLAFISEAVLNTVPDYPFKSTALLYFPDIYAACQAIVPLTNAGAMMVELMDRASLHAVEDLAGMPAVVKTLPETAAALLIEFQEDTIDKLEQRVNMFLESSQLSLLNKPEFTRDPKEQDFLWKVRKGLFPAVGAVRASGTTVILEDIAFPVEMLGDAILDLQNLFKKYAYDNAIIFGHAKDGNIHFVITQSFNSRDETIRYDRFLKEVVVLVVEKYNGTLKAEHGTGRNMAPFVETEWGGKAHEIIKRIKTTIDPALLLNPGVIVNADKNVHIKNLKPMPPVEAEVDRCIECGYCEHKCPSKDLTTTPRRRIVIRRVLQALQKSGDRKNYKLLLDQYQYDGLDTCAVDGLCATACPVDINTGNLVKRLRQENHSSVANGIASFVAKNFGFVQTMARLGIRTGIAINTIFGKNAMVSLTNGIRTVLPSTPRWSNHLTAGPDLNVFKRGMNKQIDGQNEKVVYYPACITRVMGTNAKKTRSVPDSFLSICAKAKITVIIPPEINSTCCSQIFSSKGYAKATSSAANKVVDELWKTTMHGSIPVVVDVSSCAHTLHLLGPHLNSENKARWEKLKILDSIEFIAQRIMPVASIKTKTKNIVLHPVCSLQKMKTEDVFTSVAKHFAKSVVVPQHSGCCGMAGDRGFLFPELTASATHAEGAEVREHKYDGYYSTTRTCELAMSAAVNENYESILYLVDESMTPGV